jgi:hypothetical protein
MLSVVNTKQMDKKKQHLEAMGMSYYLDCGGGNQIACLNYRQFLFSFFLLSFSFLPSFLFVVGFLEIFL